MKLLLASPTDSANRSIKVTERLQSWSPFITSSHVKAAAVISPGDTAPPLSLLPFRGAVSASLCDYTTKFGAASYMPSAKYSQYVFYFFGGRNLTGCQQTENIRPSQHCSVSLSLSTIRFYITFPIFSPLLHKANLSFAC